MEVAMVEAVLKSMRGRMRRRSQKWKNSLKRGKGFGGERMVGVKQETKVTSGRRGEDWGGGEKEERVGDFREPDRSANERQVNIYISTVPTKFY
jgi:hypothetical protein